MKNKIGVTYSISRPTTRVVYCHIQENLCEGGRKREREREREREGGREGGREKLSIYKDLRWLAVVYMQCMV